MKYLISISFVLLCFYGLNGQNYSLQNSVMAWAEANTAKPSLKLRWVAANDSVMTIHRKLRDAKSWPAKALVTLKAGETSYEDTTVSAGNAYEYRLYRITKAKTYAYTYLYGGVKSSQVSLKKTILLLVDDRVRTGINAELDRLRNDLANESWNVADLTIPAGRNAAQVKDTIKMFYAQNPGLTTIFIIGHVAVPYSGNTNWDGHPDHQGAWVCDNFYADIDGVWTDEFVSNLTPGRDENKNDLDDGKWDNDQIPSDIEFEVGRVDFFNMPALGKSEVQLLKNYLEKDHKFRIGQIRPERRAIVQDNFNFQAEYFGSSGYKNYTVFFGPDSVKTDEFRNRLLEKSYLCAYGAGGGWYQGAGGISTTGDMAKDSLRTVFTFLFGSYFGDWDVQDNFLRSSLASGTILTCAWAGRPGWQIHHMAMGESIGFSTRTTINDNLYVVSPYGNRGAHVSLLGDPSLTLFPVIPPGALTAVESGKFINLSWVASPEASEGYTVLRRKMTDKEFTRVADQIKTTSYQDQCLEQGIDYEYLVCAVKLETDASGSFFNRSAGSRATIRIKNNALTKAVAEATKDYEFVTFKARSNNSRGNQWLIDGKTISGDSILYHFSCIPETHVFKLISTGDCNADTLTSEVQVSCSVPSVDHYTIDPPIKCFGEVTSINLDRISGAAPFKFLWSNGATTNPVNNVSGKISVVITSDKGTKDTFDINLPEFAKLEITDITVRNVNPGYNKGSITGINIQGGSPPYVTKILNSIRQDSLDAGIYTLQVTDANGCTSTKLFEIKTNTAVKDIAGTEYFVFPNPCEDEFYIKLDGLVAYTILTMEGKLIQKGSIQNSAHEPVRINTSKLIPGCYNVLLEGAKDKYRTLIVKK